MKRIIFLFLFVILLFGLSFTPQAVEMDPMSFNGFYEEAFHYFGSSKSIRRDSSVISLVEHVVDITEGNTVSLHATSSIPGATINWISFNTSVATVNNNGQVSAIKADCSAVSILAYVLDANNNLYFDGCTVYVKIPDGTYYFKNKSTGLYADATGYYSGSEVLQWIFHGAENQRWAVTYLSNGVYSVVNEMSGLYMGIEALNNTTAKVTQSNYLNDSSKWRISKTASGAYCFYANGNYAYNYVIGSTLTGNTAGTSITNMSYTNDSDFRDEWIIDRMQWNYTNWYDSSFAYSADYVSKISGANVFSSNVFYREFEMPIGTTSIYRKYDILCDSCTTGIHNECDDIICGDDCSISHHKNFYRISDQLYNPQLINNITCLWTNRQDGTFCYNSSFDGEHTLVPDNTIAAVKTVGRPVIQFFNVEPGIDDSVEARMGFILLHETAHAFGLSEQYIQTFPIQNPWYYSHSQFYYNSNGYSCVMMEYYKSDADSFYNSIKAGLCDAFCEHCTESIASLINQ